MFSTLIGKTKSLIGIAQNFNSNNNNLPDSSLLRIKQLSANMPNNNNDQDKVNLQGSIFGKYL